MLFVPMYYGNGAISWFPAIHAFYDFPCLTRSAADYRRRSFLPRNHVILRYRCVMSLLFHKAGNMLGKFAIKNQRFYNIGAADKLPIDK